MLYDFLIALACVRVCVALQRCTCFLAAQQAKGDVRVNDRKDAQTKGFSREWIDLGLVKASNVDRNRLIWAGDGICWAG